MSASDQDSVPKKTPREHARELKGGGMRCNCDLDNWEPELSTGHSWVCRIHKAVVAKGLAFPWS